MNNFFRFLIGIIVAVFVLIIGLFLAVILIPAFVLGSMVWGIILFIFTILVVFAFIYYMSRKEPAHPKTKDSNNFSIASGKRR